MMNSCFLLFALLAVASCESESGLPGHLKPLGSHQKPIGGIPVTGKFPSPWVFHQEFVKNGQPLVMKKVLETDNIPAYRLWTDQYLRENFGQTDVEVEIGKKENRGSGVDQMTMSKFLHLYQTQNIYQVFDLTPDMKKDMNLPLSLQCGGFQNLLETVVMWFSSGGTKSHLHRDLLDNINCLLDGKKDILLIDKKYGDMVMADGWKEDGGYSTVDVESVDMTKFPQLHNVPYSRITISKGDCLFIPYKWLHFVDSKPGRNLAVNFWFHHLPWFNSSECDDVDPFQNSSVPLSTIKKADPEMESRMLFLELFGDVMSFYKRSFSDYIQREIPSITKEDVGSLNEVFSLIDTDGNKVLTWEELMTMDIESAIDNYPKLFTKIISNITGGVTNFEEAEHESVNIGEDPDPITVDVSESEKVEDGRSQSSIKTPDDLVKERLIELADDGNLIMEEEPVRNQHEEL